MNSLFIKIPTWVQFFFKNHTWSVKTDRKEIYVTFDDGPTPEITEWVLTQLAKYNAKATFFCIGKNIEAHPEIFKKIIQARHSIGNHTYNHLKGWNVKTDAYLDNIKKTETLLNSYQLPNTKRLFRPPYGKIKRSQTKKIKEENYEIIMWKVLSADFDNSISKEKCLENVLKNSTKGAIVVFHDSIKAANNMKYALPKVLEYYSKKGYSFRALT